MTSHMRVQWMLPGNPLAAGKRPPLELGNCNLVKLRCAMASQPSLSAPPSSILAASEDAGFPASKQTAILLRTCSRRNHQR